MLGVFKDMVKIGVTFPKDQVKLPKGWNKFTESRYIGEDHYAILTGSVNDIVVVDLDFKESSFIGLQWLEENIGRVRSLNTLVTKTVNGGYHIYFKYSKKIKNINNKHLHIDVLVNNRCCYQGKEYPIISDNPIRELTTDEISTILLLTKEYKPQVEEIVINKDTKVYKKANMLFDKPENMEWDVVKTDKGCKAVPNCKQCLVDPNHIHSHEEHSALFINTDDQSVIKTCHSCGSECVSKREAKKIINVFNVVMNVNQDNTIYQELVNDLIKTGSEEKYKRQKNTGIVYKQVRPYAYVKYLEPMDFLNEVFLGDVDFRSNVNNMDNVIKFMKQYNDPNFPFLEYSKEHIGFSNGVLNIITCEFDEDPDDSIVCAKYIDQEFTYSTDTPLFDSILKYQFDDSVVDFVYMCLGRMFGIRDNYGFMLYLLGEPGCGKSVILDVLCECFNNVGAIGSTFEEKFGLSFLYDKDIVVCDDLPKNISKIFPQQTFQTCITGGKIPVAVKGGEGFTVDWRVPMLWAGNWFPDYIDKGQISRRMLVANFEKNVTNPDTTLKHRILTEELPAFIYKCLSEYKKLLDLDTNKEIWGLCPEYFLEQQQELKIERNPLYKFLIENTKYKEGSMMLLETVRVNFNNWLGKSVRSLDNGTFGQVNKEYIVDTIKACKHCNKEAKSGCCDKYKHSDRTRKKVVRNMWLNIPEL